MPSELGMGKNKQVHEAPTAAEQNMAGWGEGGWDGWETTTPVARNEGECRGQKAGMIEPEGQEQAWGRPRSRMGCWRLVTPQPDHNTPGAPPQVDHV